MRPVPQAWLALFLLVPAACAEGDVLTLGGNAPLPYRFGPPRLIANLDVGPKLDNPTLTSDLLELYFTSGEAETDTDVWVARRAQREAPFEPPELVHAVNSPAFETSSAISADGLSLWFGSNRGRPYADHDIWVATRSARDAPWSAPRSVPELNSNNMDIPRPPGQRGLVMPMSSDRQTVGYYQVFLAERSDPTQPFREPDMVSELRFPRSASADAFLSDDGLTLFFSSNVPPNLLDLYVAWRKSTDEPFEAYAKLEDLSTDGGDERDPWLSPDGSELYFASDRSGSHEIYVSTVTRSED